jgi:hypothetical protein
MNCASLTNPFILKRDFYTEFSECRLSSRPNWVFHPPTPRASVAPPNVLGGKNS